MSKPKKPISPPWFVKRTATGQFLVVNRREGKNETPCLERGEAVAVRDKKNAEWKRRQKLALTPRRRVVKKARGKK